MKLTQYFMTSKVLRTPPIQKPVQSVPTVQKPAPFVQKSVPDVQKPVQAIVEIGDSESSQNEVNSEEPQLEPINVLRNLITIAAKATKHVVTNLAKQAAENAEEDEDNTVLDFSSGSAQETESTGK